MPDPYDPDAARRALDQASPAADLWAEAERRAADASVVPLSVGRDRVRRPGRWLAVAAVAALAVGTVAVITNDGDDQPLDMAPSDSSSRTRGPLCDFASPRILQRGPAPALVTPERSDTARVYFSGLAYAVAADSQQYEVAVPSDPRADADAGETTSVELERGSAVLRATSYFTQVRWEPEGAGLCDTFSVTLQSRPSDATTQAVVDLANDIELLGELPAGGQLTSVADPTDCRFAISGEPVSLPRPGPVDQPILGSVGAAPDQATVQYELGSQRAEVSVPGFTVRDLVGERVDDIELARGTAQIWFTADFVQVRWFPGGVEPCETFTITVAGGTENANRYVAVDLADRLLLDSDLAAGPSLRGTQWQLERSTVDGQPTDGDGSTFRFRQNDVQWSDGCNDFSGPFQQDFATDLVIGGDDPTTLVTGTDIGCPPNPTSDAIATVMGAERIDVRYEDDLLILTAGATELALRPVGNDGSAGPPVGTTADGYAIWPVTRPGQPIAEPASGRARTGDAALAYAVEVLGWQDAVVVDSEPSEDGRGGRVDLVRSEEVGGAVLVWTAQGSGDDGSIVYRLDVPGRSEEEQGQASVHISGVTALVDGGPSPAGTSMTDVRLRYGDDVIGGGSPGEELLLSRTPDTPGAVVVRFFDSEGRVISAWGRALPAGDLIED